MTLIFSHVSDQTGLLVASDLLTSRSDRFGEEQVQLPVREKPLSHRNAGSALAGLSQKTIILGPTLVSFAGSVIVAKALLSALQKQSEDGMKPLELSDLVEESGLAPDEVADVSLIYHYASGEFIKRQTINCININRGRFDNILGQGSGIWNFFDNMTVDFPESPSHVQVIQRLVSRISGNFLGEMLGTETLDYMYGGWFELATRHKDSYQKIPYGLKFWAMQGGILSSGGPALMSWYKGHHLNVTKFPITGQGPEKDYPSSTIFVPDILRRGLAGAPTSVIKPQFVVHLIIDLDKNYQRIIFSPDPESDGFEMSVSPEGQRVRFTQDFYLRLFKNVREASARRPA